VNNPVCYPPLPSPPSYIIYVQHCKLPCLNYVTHCVGILCHAEDVTRFVECACVTIQVFEEFIVNASKNRTFFIGARKSCPTSDAKSLAVPRLAGEGACRIKHGNALGKWISRRGRRIREKRITRRPVLYVICNATHDHARTNQEGLTTALCIQSRDLGRSTISSSRLNVLATVGCPRSDIRVIRASHYSYVDL